MDHVDRILVLDQGKLAEAGTHTELIRRNGLYADMWTRQQAEGEEIRKKGLTDQMKAITAEARDLFRRPMNPHDLKGCDAIVFDPPRAGAIDQTAQIADTKAGVVVGVSCNPQTFARDARVLIDAGFRLETVTPVDQFLWSSHVELVGVFKR